MLMWVRINTRSVTIPVTEPTSFKVYWYPNYPMHENIEAEGNETDEAYELSPTQQTAYIDDEGFAVPIVFEVDKNTTIVRQYMVSAHWFNSFHLTSSPRYSQTCW